MVSLWQGIATDSIGAAMPSFFTLDSYLAVKSLTDDSYDYAHRLLEHFALDIEAAHALIASQGGDPTYLGVRVPTSEANWVTPGTCYNKVGYWHVPGARLLYSINGVEHSIGIFSLISWHGEWYVVHLGLANRATNTGVVDSAAIGPGTFPPPGGC
jgi:hypothetical protein